MGVDCLRFFFFFFFLEIRVSLPLTISSDEDAALGCDCCLVDDSGELIFCRFLLLLLSALSPSDSF